MDKSERKALKKMIEEVKGNSLRLDAGFVDRELTSRIDELGMKPLIFPRKNLDINFVMIVSFSLLRSFG